MKINPPVTGKGTLFYQMSSNATLDTSIDFSAKSSATNGLGVYELSSTADDTYPIYYYRGAVTDNNVLFANFCWKIVRTTETGGIKLIYNGVPSNGQCNNTGTSSQIGTSAFNSGSSYNSYVGYMYGTSNSSNYSAEHTNTNSSTIKTTIDTWYEINMTNYTDKIEDAVWCNDRSISSGSGYATNKTYYGVYGRLISNKTPSLVCSSTNDKFTVSMKNGNGALKYPVGLITADEVAYAGGVIWVSSNFYLYTGSTYWVGSPIYFDSSSFELTVDEGGVLDQYRVSDSLGIRPAISLKPATTYSSGSGTATDPYVVN